MSNTLNIDLAGLAPSQVMQILDSVDRIRNIAVDEPPPPTAVATSTPVGWTLEHVDYLRDKLAARGKRIQLAAFDKAIEDGGYIDRASVYALGNYAPDRQLKNWTTPIRKIVEELVSRHGLPRESDGRLPDAMWPYYGEGTSFRPLLGYFVAPEIVELRQGAN